MGACWVVGRRKSRERPLSQTFELVARPKRFELLTPRFVVWCSIQLSYGRVWPSNGIFGEGELEPKRKISEASSLAVKQALPNPLPAQRQGWRARGRSSAKPARTLQFHHSIGDGDAEGGAAVIADKRYLTAMSLDQLPRNG